MPNYKWNFPLREPGELETEREGIAEGTGFVGGFEFDGFADGLDERFGGAAFLEFVEDAGSCRVVEIASAVPGAAGELRESEGAAIEFLELDHGINPGC